MTPISRVVRATNWKYAFGELILIIVGISLALAIDEWREDAEDRRTELEYIEQLIRDLKSTEEVMASVVTDNALADDAATRLLTIFEDGEYVEPREIRKLLWTKSFFDNPVPILGTAEALVATGDLRLIRDSSIRSRVTQYLSHARDLRLASLYDLESNYHSSDTRLSKIAAAHGVIPTRPRVEGQIHQASDVEGFLAHSEAYAEVLQVRLLRREFAAYRKEVSAGAAELRELLVEYVKPD
jgi:hypothetical protein